MTALDKATRELIWDRAGGCCECCGTGLTRQAWHSIQHRVARGVGGSNQPSNLVLLCGSATSRGCHRRCEDRDEFMHLAGFWLRSDEDPAGLPVPRDAVDPELALLKLPALPGTWRWLTDDGGYATEPPAEEAA